MAISRHRRREVRATTLKYLGDLIHAHPNGDTGLYVDLDDEECELAKRIAEDEGRKLRERSARARETNNRELEHRRLHGDPRKPDLR